MKTIVKTSIVMGKTMAIKIIARMSRNFLVEMPDGRYRFLLVDGEGFHWQETRPGFRPESTWLKWNYDQIEPVVGDEQQIGDLVQRALSARVLFDGTRHW
jgi:hypothetical protein